MRITKWILVTLTFLLCVSCQKSNKPILATSGVGFDGIDVSHHNGNIDWEEVGKTKQIKFVYIKATTGATGVDPCYKHNIEGAHKIGLKVGSYHFLTSKTPIRQQFENFKSVANKKYQDLIPMIDVEEDKNMKWKAEQVKDSLALFIQLLTDYYGKAPMIYGTNKSYNTYCAPTYNNYHLMIGRYSKKKPQIKGAGEYSIWQFSQSGKVPGIPRSVDLSRINPKYKLADFEL